MKIHVLTLFFFSAILISGTSSAQLSGNYTINSGQATGGTNFQTFTDFASSLNTTGVSGNVIATVTPGSGPYTEQVIFSNIPGTGAGATITIEGSGETITALTDSANRHVVRLSDVQYFTINNLHVMRNPAALSGFYGIHIYNSGNNITISNCSVDMSGSNSTLVGAYIVSGSVTSILDSGEFHFINIVNDTATGGGYGASVFGKASSLATDIVISGNTFLDFHSNGVYLRETNGAIISHNYLNKRDASVTSCNAIQIAQAANINANIFNNYITMWQTSNGTMQFRGIYLFNGTGHKVYNNVITDIRLLSGNFTGIEVRTGGTAPEIYFNTIALENAGISSGDLYGIAEELSNTNSVLRNNLISLTQPTTGDKIALVLGATSNVTTAINSDYNLIWAPNGNVAKKDAINPTYYTLLSNWQAASNQDSNSFMADPQLLVDTLPIPTNINADNLGTPIAGITTDFTGILRAAIPDIGAYEFPLIPDGILESVQSKILVYPNPFSSTLNFKFENSDVTEFVLYNAVAGKVLTEKISNTASVNTVNLPAGIYYYELRGEKNILSKGKLIKQ
jgi:hypothetical protein